MKIAASSLNFLALAFALLASRLHGQTPAATPDERLEYDVIVRQQSIGKVSIHVQASKDGSTVSVTDTHVEAQYLLITHRYDYHGQETWRGNRLVGLESRTNDNGTQLAVTATVDSSGSTVNIKGKPPNHGPAFLMTSNFWRLPDLKLAAGKFAIIDSDTGTTFNVQLAAVGSETVVLDNRKIPCQHYRISGDTAAELWYDGQGRLVRQQTVEQGFQTELRLARLSSNATAP
jgi:hypothetical protein